VRAHFTPQAEINLEGICAYIALENRRPAVSFIREIRNTVRELPMELITKWRFQTWATRYAFARTDTTDEEG